MHARAEILWDAGGRPYRMIGTAQDITEMRRAAEALVEKGRKMEGLLESTSDAYLELDGEWRVGYANREAARVLGLERDELVGEVLWDAAPELASAFFKPLRMAVADGSKMDFEGYYPPLQRWLECHAYPDGDGLWLFFRDISLRRRHEDDLRDKEAHQRALLDNLFDGIITIDENGRIDTFNKAAERMFGYGAEEVRGHNVTELMPERFRERHDRALHRRATGHRSTDFTRIQNVRALRKDGGHFPMELALTEVHRGERLFFIGVVRDLTEQREAEQGLQLAERVFESSIEGILVTDAEGRVVRVNDAFCEITGYDREEVLGEKASILKSGRHDDEFFERMWHALLNEGKWQGEVWNRRKNGEVFPEWLSINAIVDEEGAVSHYVAVFDDISEKKAAEERIERLAYYDPLTELPNRLTFRGRLEQAMASLERGGGRVAILYIDLDRFKNINDTLGHSIGDQLLRHAAERLLGSVRRNDTVARLGGDEFVVMLTGLHRDDEVTPIAEKILHEMAEPFQLEGHEVFVTTSIGIAFFPSDAEGMEDLVKNADTAMYHAKESGRNNYQFYRAEMNATAMDRLVMESNLRRALERGEFRLHYQPQLNLRSGEVVGVECLIRWQHPERGLVSPVEFIPMLEETGLIVSVGAWVLREACEQQVAWSESGIKLRMAVNLSPHQFAQSILLDTIAEVVEQSGIEPDMLELEITEGSLMKDAEASARTLARLKVMGIRLSVDDFGTGYSSLSYLKRFPIDTLKIDSSFVRDVTTDPDDAAIAGTVIAMGHSLNLNVLAEGVEEREQLAFLQGHGCDEMQGYYFSRPLPASELEAQLRGGRRLMPNGAIDEGESAA